MNNARDGRVKRFEKKLLPAAAAACYPTVPNGRNAPFVRPVALRNNL